MKNLLFVAYCIFCIFLQAFARGIKNDSNREAVVFQHTYQPEIHLFIASEDSKTIEKKTNNKANYALRSNPNLGFTLRRTRDLSASGPVFIENKGQWNSEVLYLCRMGGLDAWITRYGINYTFFTIEEDSTVIMNEPNQPGKYNSKQHNLVGHRILMKLQNISHILSTEGMQKQEGYHNYLIGNNPEKHVAFTRLFKEVLIKNIFEGIDLHYYFDKNSLRYDYIVHPGADPTLIVFNLEGSDTTYLNELGQLVFTSRFGQTSLAELRSYQLDTRKEIKSKFVPKGDKWAIELGKYNHAQTLIIDPLVYSTFIGGSDADWAYGLTVDNSGYAYVTGFTSSPNYDVTPGAFQITNGGGEDVFVTKINLTGGNLIYSSFLGGSSMDEGYGIAVKESGQVYVTGRTQSADFDVTPGAFQTAIGGSSFYGGDAFIANLNSTGSALLYSTYIGGSNDDAGIGIEIDGGGFAYVSGLTYSPDYDITPGAFQTAKGGDYDVFVTKLNPSGTALVYSTFIGGNSYDGAQAIALDNNGQAYVTGWTRSGNYRVTPGAFQTTYGGGSLIQGDSFITKLNATGTALIYSTYLGGNRDDFGTDIAVDENGQAYVCGKTNSANFDITPGAFQTGIGGEDTYDGFVTKLNVLGSALVYSTYIGGMEDDYIAAIKVDGNKQAMVTGYTNSANYPVTTGAYQTNYQGNFEVLATKLNEEGTSLVYSTYIGGNLDDEGYEIALDSENYAYITGTTWSSNYDITSGAFQANIDGDHDLFITKLCLGEIMSLSLSSAPGTDNQTLCINTPLTPIVYSTIGAVGATVSGLPDGVTGVFTVNSFIIDGTPIVTGTFTYTLTLSGGCGTAIATGIITVDDCLGISTIKKECLWGVYPNPNKGTFTIYTTEDGVFELMNLTGRLLQTFTIKNPTESIHVDFPAGTYYMRKKEDAVIQALIIE